MDGEQTDPRKLLLIEDAPFLRIAMGRLLRLHGYDVQEAENGCDALLRIDAFQPELVLTDLAMPAMDGVEFITQLRLDPRTATLPVVVLTGDATAPNEHRARLAGANDFLSKPVDLPLLLARLRSVRNDPVSSS